MLINLASSSGANLLSGGGKDIHVRYLSIEKNICFVDTSRIFYLYTAQVRSIMFYVRSHCKDKRSSEL
jgi:hypothetical protein